MLSEIARKMRGEAVKRYNNLRSMSRLIEDLVREDGGVTPRISSDGLNDDVAREKIDSFRTGQ